MSKTGYVLQWRQDGEWINFSSWGQPSTCKVNSTLNLLYWTGIYKTLEFRIVEVPGV